MQKLGLRVFERGHAIRMFPQLFCFPVAQALELLERERVGDGDTRMVGQHLQQDQVVITERPRLTPYRPHRAQPLAPVRHGCRHHRAHRLVFDDRCLRPLLWRESGVVVDSLDLAGANRHRIHAAVQAHGVPLPVLGALAGNAPEPQQAGRLIDQIDGADVGREQVAHRLGNTGQRLVEVEAGDDLCRDLMNGGQGIDAHAVLLTHRSLI